MGKTAGIILIVLGIVLLIWTGFTYTKREKVIDAGQYRYRQIKKNQ